MPAEGARRREPDRRRVGAGELRRCQAERGDPVAVLGDEGRRQLGPSGVVIDLRRGRLEQPDVEVVLGVAQCEHRARVMAQVADLARLRAWSGSRSSRRPTRTRSARGAAPRRARIVDSQIDRLRLEEPLDAQGGEGRAVHGRRMSARLARRPPTPVIDRHGHPSGGGQRPLSPPSVPPSPPSRSSRLPVPAPPAVPPPIKPTQQAAEVAEPAAARARSSSPPAGVWPFGRQHVDELRQERGQQRQQRLRCRARTRSTGAGPCRVRAHAPSRCGSTGRFSPVDTHESTSSSRPLSRSWSTRPSSPPVSSIAPARSPIVAPTSAPPARAEPAAQVGEIVHGRPPSVTAALGGRLDRSPAGCLAHPVGASGRCVRILAAGPTATS